MKIEDLAKLDFKNPNCIEIMTKHWDVLIDIAKICENILLTDLTGYNERRLTDAMEKLEEIK